MGFANKAIAAACTGLAAAAIVGCGSGGNLLTRDQANALSQQLQRASVALADSNCGAAHSAIRNFDGTVNGLGGVNATLRSNLQQGESTIARLAAKQCPTHSPAPTPTTTTPTTITPPKPAPKPNATTTTTTTTPATTTTTTSTPTTPSAPTPSTPTSTTPAPPTGGTGLPGGGNAQGGQASNDTASPTSGPQGHASGYYRNHGGYGQ